MIIKIIEHAGNINEVKEKVCTYVIADFDIGIGKIPLSIIQAAGDMIVGTGPGQVAAFPKGPPGTYICIDENGNLAYKAVGSGSEDITPCNGRLSLESGSAVTTTNQLAKTSVVFTPFEGNLIGLKYGASWLRFFLSECLIKLTDTQTGTITNGSNSVTGLSGTSQLIAGMEVSGIGIPAGATIASIVSTTQITLSANATDTGEKGLTFKVPASTVLDIFTYWTGTAVKLEMVKWTNATTRAIALAKENGIDVKTGDATRRYIGTIATSSAAGQTEDSCLNRLVWNAYNRIPRVFKITESTVSWSYASAVWRPWNNNTANRVNFVNGLIETFLEAKMHGQIWNTAGYVGLGLDKTNGNDAPVYTYASNVAVAQYNGYPGLGLHYLQVVEYASGSCTFYGNGIANGVGVSGAVGHIMG